MNTIVSRTHIVRVRRPHDVWAAIILGSSALIEIGILDGVCGLAHEPPYADGLVLLAPARVIDASLHCLLNGKATTNPLEYFHSSMPRNRIRYRVQSTDVALSLSAIHGCLHRLPLAHDRSTPKEKR